MKLTVVFTLLLPSSALLAGGIAGCSSAAPAGESGSGAVVTSSSAAACSVTDFQTGAAADLSQDHSPFATLILNNPRVAFTPSNGSSTTCPTTIHEVISAFDAIPQATRQVFAVDETGDQPQQSDGGHRFVISQRTGAAGGTDADILLAPLENASSPGSLDISQLEVISYDPVRQVNVFYKFMQGHWNLMGNGGQIDPQQSQNVPAESGNFFCQGCHPTGALNFKERQLPWNNWNGFFAMPGFPSSDPLMQAWFAGKAGSTPAAVPDAKEPTVGSAYKLETLIENGNTRLTVNRVRHILANDAPGAFPNQSLQTLLREVMCDVGEVNLATAGVNSRLQPATDDVLIPASFLLDSQLSQILGPIPDVTLPNASYLSAISNQSIHGISGATDTMFAFLVPERSFVSERVEVALIGSWLTNQQLAAILMTDFPNTMFSAQRCGLASTIPTVPAGTAATDATNGATAFISNWVAALQAAGTPGASGLAKRLASTTALDASPLTNYLAKCTARLASDPTGLTADLVTLAQQRRQELLVDPHLDHANQGFPQIVESSALLPQTSASVTPGALHMQPDCTLGSSSVGIGD